ncbi:MAG TPA: hypothetical protein VF271_06965 [Rhodanobacteraceae bacterium]
MNTKLLITTSLAAALFGIASAASASSIYADNGSDSLSPYSRGALPVLVQVNNRGTVTDIAPAYPLKPRFRRLLRQSVDGMVTGPAHDKAGRAIPSQFVMYLTTQTSARADGEYNFSFKYLKAIPVPAGAWYWGHLDGRRLALISQGNGTQMFRPHFRHHWRSVNPVYHSYYPTPSQTAPQPSFQNRRPVRPVQPSRHGH